MGRSVTPTKATKNARGAKKVAGAKPAKKIVNSSRATAAKNVVAKKPDGRSATTGSARSSRSTPTQ